MSATFKIPYRIAALVLIAHYCPMSLADSPTPEGMKGWLYDSSGYGPTFYYKPTALEACRAMKVPLALYFTHMTASDVERVPSGIAYTCHFTFPGMAVDYPLPTRLFCEAGYYPRWPGVCAEHSLPPPPSCSPSDKGALFGNPVMITNGVKIQRDVEPVGPSFAISRTYRSSRIPVRRPTAGTAWSFSFERDFVFSGTTVRIMSGEGSQVQFERRSDGTYVARGYEKDTLVPTGAGADEWVHTSGGGVVDHYRKVGTQYLLFVTSTSNGKAMFFTYDEAGRVKTISDSFGRVLHVTWKHPDGIASIVGPGLRIEYAYEQERWVTDEHQPMTIRLGAVGIFDPAVGAVVMTQAYRYENDDSAPGFYFLTGIRDGKGDLVSTYTYDRRGRVTSSVNAEGVNARQYSFGPDLVKVSDGSGAEHVFSLKSVDSNKRITSISQPAGAGCGPAVSALTYTTEGLVASSTDFNKRKTCFIYDRTRLQERHRIEGVSATATCPEDSPIVRTGQRMTTREWHPDWHLESKIAEPLKITTFVYNGQPDLNGEILNCAEGGTLPNQKPIAVVCKKIEQATTDTNGAKQLSAVVTGAARVVSFTYNRLGQLLSETRFGRDPINGDTTRFAYFEDSTDTHTVGDLWKVINAKGHVTEFLEYTPAGIATKIRTGNGQTTSVDYNARQQVIRRVTAKGTAEEFVTEFTYDLAGQLTNLKQSDGSSLQYTYDKAHRLIAIHDSGGNSIRYTLDGAGNRLNEEVRDVTGNLVRTVSKVYDALNRLQGITEGVIQ